MHPIFSLAIAKVINLCTDLLWDVWAAHDPLRQLPTCTIPTSQDIYSNFPLLEVISRGSPIAILAMK